MRRRTSTRRTGCTTSQSQRIAQLEQQIATAAGEKQRREEENAALATQQSELAEMRAQAIAEGETLSTEAATLARGDGGAGREAAHAAA